MAASPGILLVGHGTRSADGVQQFLDIASLLRQQAAPLPVEPAFLELAEPPIPLGVERLIGQGATSLLVAPFLLAAADHVKEDIPAAVRQAIASLAHPPAFTFAEHLGAHDLLVGLSRRRFRETLASSQPARAAISAAKTCHLLVGRGTHDQSAIAEVRRFAALAKNADLAAETRVAFLAIAEPSLAAELARLAAEPYEKVVIQPHLLFEGDLSRRVRELAAEMSLRHPRIRWLVTPVLADPAKNPAEGSQWLAKAAWDRCQSARV